MQLSAFGSGAVTTCFYDLGPSRPEIEPQSPAHGPNALLLRHRGGLKNEVKRTMIEYEARIVLVDIPMGRYRGPR